MERKMSMQSQYKTLFAYHFDLVQRLISAAANLNDADYRANPGYGHGSIHEILFHWLVTDLRWRTGLETGRRMSVLTIEDVPDLKALQGLCESEKSAWTSYLERLTEEDIAGNATITSSRGEVADILRWRIMMQVLLHGMQHAAELAEMLTLKGQSPGNIDFIFYQ
jgi:uncharacterized damage-inducible protein DinB